MKLVIGAVSVLLCIQMDVCAMESPTDYQRQSKNFKGDSKDFFIRFQKEHNVSVQYLDDLIKLCNELRDTVFALDRELKSDEAECKVAKFLEFYYAKRLKMLSKELSLMERIYYLINTADQHRCSFDCNGEKHRSNDGLSCDILTFLKGLTPIGYGVIDTISDLIDTSRRSYDIARKFACTHRPNCKKHNCGDKNLFSEAKRLTDILKREISIGEDKVFAIKKTCNQLSAEITDWIEKLGK